MVRGDCCAGSLMPVLPSSVAFVFFPKLLSALRPARRTTSRSSDPIAFRSPPPVPVDLAHLLCVFFQDLRENRPALRRDAVPLLRPVRVGVWRIKGRRSPPPESATGASESPLGFRCSRELSSSVGAHVPCP